MPRAGRWAFWSTGASCPSHDLIHYTVVSTASHWEPKPRSVYEMKCSALIIATLSAVVLTGCYHSNDVSYSSITRNLTPELQTLTERPSDVHTNIAVSRNQDMRMLQEDLGRLMLLDGPSKLSPYPIIDTAGNP